ncbi:MAG: SDR family oxidoreductase [Deltaproteobacteria bacterium]|nr:SDR family oxidoreductase [Deltaproteobacteria bacterium]
MSEFHPEVLFSLKGKVALVTGGSRGIGKMITQGLLSAGAKVYITARKKESCDRTAEELKTLGTCISLPADVGTADGRQGLLSRFMEKEDRLHILVNNAGANWGEAFSTYPEDAFHKVMNLNVTSVFVLTRDFTGLLEKGATADDPARVVNIGSMDGLHIPTVSRTGTFAYTSSKAAVHHLTRDLAIQLSSRHITVNAIAPGFFPSKMTDFVFEKYKTDIEANCPLKRVGKAEEMAGVAVYLCSRAGAYTNGAVIPVDGGTSINHQHVQVSRD